MDAIQILNEVIKISENKISNQQDLEIFLSYSIQNNKLNNLEELSFQAKFIYGLYNSLQTKHPDFSIEAMERLQEEFKNALLNFSKILTDFINGQNDFHKKVLINKYVVPTERTLQNIISLCKDLNYLKIYFNNNKHNR
jgi:hypothetical protein